MILGVLSHYGTKKKKEKKEKKEKKKEKKKKKKKKETITRAGTTGSRH